MGSCCLAIERLEEGFVCGCFFESQQIDCLNISVVLCTSIIAEFCSVIKNYKICVVRLGSSISGI